MSFLKEVDVMLLAVDMETDRNSCVKKAEVNLWERLNAIPPSFTPTFHTWEYRWIDGIPVQDVFVVEDGL